jgi:hypothetical protein
MAARPDRATVPQDRYAMASGCYGLRSVRTGTWVKRDGDGFRTGAGSYSTGTPLHFQATDLGRYLLYGNRQDFVAQHHDSLGTGDAVESADAPSEHADWTVTTSGADFLLRIGTKYLSVAPGGALVMSTRHEPYRMRTRSGCAAWPEVQTNVSGRPFKGVSPIQEVRGTVDAHTHGMAFEFLGGDVHCGRPGTPTASPTPSRTAPTTTSRTVAAPRSRTCSTAGSPATATTPSAGPPSRTGRRRTR